jgi:acetylornithine deacetylase/succinyl-diaminopimelate desuccinylase-like protein
MSDIRAQLQQKLTPTRIVQEAADLIRIPSPTGDSKAVTELYADRLRALGLDAEYDETVPGSPSVVAYLDGGHPGPTLELAGHLDVIPAPHDPPEIRENRLYGRGAQDMKGGMAAALEVLRLLATVREHLHGRLMVCAYGMHEAPLGRGQVLDGLLARGIVGDAVINVEGPLHEVPVIGKGMSTFEITVERPGAPMHELAAPPDLVHPITVGLEIGQMLRAWDEELRQGEDLPYVGPESVFVGQFESGDFYNRVPNRCQIVGTRRYAPEQRFDVVLAEFQSRLDPIRRRTGAEIALDLVKTRDGFRVPEDARVVRLLQQGYAEVTGKRLPVGGFKAVGDVSSFVNEGGVPAVYFGCGLDRSHATPEYVTLEELETLARVLSAASALYLGI